MREARAFLGIRCALGGASTSAFRVVHFSVQSDHIHLLVEADDARSWRCGVHGLTIRVAKALNRALRRRGAVWADRYHARLLPTPRQVRYALVYVLQNWRKHGSHADGVDPRSSAAWFTGWRCRVVPSRGDDSPVARARTWLLAFGWRRHGLIGLQEVPNAGRVSRAGTRRKPVVQER